MLSNFRGVKYCYQRDKGKVAVTVVSFSVVLLEPQTSDCGLRLRAPCMFGPHPGERGQLCILNCLDLGNEKNICIYMPLRMMSAWSSLCLTGSDRLSFGVSKEKDCWNEEILIPYEKILPALNTWGAQHLVAMPSCIPCSPCFQQIGFLPGYVSLETAAAVHLECSCLHLCSMSQVTDQGISLHPYSNICCKWVTQGFLLPFHRYGNLNFREVKGLPRVTQLV